MFSDEHHNITCFDFVDANATTSPAHIFEALTNSTFTSIRFEPLESVSTSDTVNVRADMAAMVGG